MRGSANHCANCPYRRQSAVGNDGPPDASLAVIGEAPGRDEIRRGRPFIGRSGDLLTRLLERAGLSRDETFITNALRCQPTDSPPVPAAIDACSERLWNELTASPRKVTIAFGNSAMRSLTGDHKLKITSERGKPFELEGLGIVVPTFHPASVLRNMDEFPKVLADVKYAGDLYRNGLHAVKSKGTTRWDLVTERNLKSVIEFLTRQQFLAADIETGSLREYGAAPLGLSPRLDDILMLGVGWRKNRVAVFPDEVIIRNGRLRRELRELLEADGPRWIWHNGKYDVQWLRAKGANARCDEDTMLMHYALDEKKGTHSLEQLASDLLGAEDWKYMVRPYTKKARGYERVPRDILYPYAAEDVDSTFQIYQVLSAKLAKSKVLTHLYRDHLMPASDFLMKLEERGIPMDLDYMNGKLIPTMQGLADKALETFRSEAAPVWNPEQYAVESGAKTVPKFLNPGSQPQVLWVMNKLGFPILETHEIALRAADRGDPLQTKSSTREARLIRWKQGGRVLRRVSRARSDVLAEQPLPGAGREDRSAQARHPIIQSLLTYRTASKMLKTFGMGLLNRVEPDGRIHTSYLLHGTETGRLSSRQPNLQNIPTPRKREPVAIRASFAAQPGYVFIEFDYSQIELRLLAHFSKDQFLLGVYKDERDLHTEVAIAMYGEEYTEDERMRAKAVNFGIAYGRGADSIADEYGITVEEGQRIIDEWRGRMPQAAAFIRQTRQAVIRGRTMTSVFGRRRRFGVITRDNLNLLQNEGSNFMTQSTASDLTLRSAMAIQRGIEKRGWDAHVLNLVHDSILIEARLDQADEIMEFAKATMERVPAQILKPEGGLVFAASGKMARNWSELK